MSNPESNSNSRLASIQQMSNFISAVSPLIEKANELVDEVSENLRFIKNRTNNENSRNIDGELEFASLVSKVVDIYHDDLKITLDEYSTIGNRISAGVIISKDEQDAYLAKLTNSFRTFSLAIEEVRQCKEDIYQYFDEDSDQVTDNGSNVEVATQRKLNNLGNQEYYKKLAVVANDIDTLAQSYLRESLDFAEDIKKTFKSEFSLLQFKIIFFEVVFGIVVALVFYKDFLFIIPLIFGLLILLYVNFTAKKRLINSLCDEYIKNYKNLN